MYELYSNYNMSFLYTLCHRVNYEVFHWQATIMGPVRNSDFF